MSGDPGITEPVIFYTSEMTLAKSILLKHHTHTVQTKEEYHLRRWRTSSPLQE